MSISKNWKAKSIDGIAGYEIIVTSEANTGLLTVVPELVKRIPQGINPTILLLDLLNANDGQPENFQDVQYNEKTSAKDQYKTVEIFHGGTSIQTIPVVPE